MIETFHAPDTVAEAAALGEALGARAAFLAGGTALNARDWGEAPPHVIHLAALGLEGVEVRGDTLIAGACTTLQALLEAPGIPPALRAACQSFTNRNVRNMATLGGQIAAGHAYASATPALIALEARLRLASGLEVAIESYLAGARRALITHVRLPAASAARPTAVRQHTRNANDRPAVTVAVSVAESGSIVRAPIVALGGVAPHVQRLEALERRLEGSPPPPRAELEAWVRELGPAPVDDLRGSAALKRHLSGVLVAAALREALGLAGEGST